MTSAGPGVVVRAVRDGVDGGIERVGHREPGMWGEVQAAADGRRRDDEYKPFAEVACTACESLGDTGSGGVRERRFGQIEHEASARLGEQACGVSFQLDGGRHVDLTLDL